MVWCGPRFKPWLGHFCNPIDTSSELRLSYVDDIPLKKRFPFSKPPTISTSATELSSKEAPTHTQKPLTITLPATSHKPMRSVTDILRELKKPASISDDKTTPLITATESKAAATRFGGAQVEYSASALQHEATAFADALATSAIPSQPSPPASGIQSNPSGPPDIPHPATNLHD